MTTDRSVERRLIFSFIFLVGVFIAGTIGYVVLEEMTPFEAFYMTVISVTTVGYGEVQPLEEAGRAFTIVLLLAGVGTLFYSFGTLMEYMVSGQMARSWEKRRVRNQVERMSNHAIICGFGRVGTQVAEEMARLGDRFVVVDHNPEAISRCRALGYAYVEGDAGADATLRQAGIEQARVLFACVDSDASNIYVTLSARGLQPKLFIVARANLENAEDKLHRAGADRVVSPYSLGGRRMAAMATKPMVTDFLDTVMHTQDVEFELGETMVGECARDGLSVDHILHTHPGSLLVLAIRHADGTLVTKPQGSLRLRPGDCLIAAGTPEELQQLQAQVEA